jgi:hypothetical protein
VIANEKARFHHPGDRLVAAVNPLEKLESDRSLTGT